MTRCRPIRPSAQAHVPAKACPALDAGWAPVRRQAYAPRNVLAETFRAVAGPGKRILLIAPMIRRDGSACSGEVDAGSRTRMREREGRRTARVGGTTRTVRRCTWREGTEDATF